VCVSTFLDDEPCCSNTRLYERILRMNGDISTLARSGVNTDFIPRTKCHQMRYTSKAVLAGTDRMREKISMKELPAAM
jgi:beta-glucosidase